MDESKKTAADKRYEEILSKIDSEGLSLTITVKSNDAGDLVACLDSTDENPAIALWMLTTSISTVVCDIINDHSDETLNSILDAITNVCTTAILAARAKK